MYRKKKNNKGKKGRGKQKNTEKKDNKRNITFDIRERTDKTK